MRKYLVEFIGTFFLVLSVCSAVRTQEGFENFAPLAIGLSLMVMVYAGGPFSGAHYNPAVSLAVYIRGKLTLVEMFGYWVVQLMAGVVAALVAANLFGFHATPEVPNAVFAPLMAESIGTFALVYVILNVATINRTANNQYYGLAIGFTVVGMAYAVGPVSGGVFNPAVALGITVFEKIAWPGLWIYIAGSIAGALIAAFAFKGMRLHAD